MPIRSFWQSTKKNQKMYCKHDTAFSAKDMSGFGLFWDVFPTMCCRPYFSLKAFRGKDKQRATKNPTRGLLQT